MRAMLQTAPRAYIDKVMVDSAATAAGDADQDADTTGDFRSWFSETRAVLTTEKGDGLPLRSSLELGESTGYRRETVNYGNYELLTDVRASSGSTALDEGPLQAATSRRSERITLRSTGFPLTTRVFADTAVGDTFSDITDALTRNYRLSLGTRPVRGLSTRIHSSEFDLRAGYGERGSLVGGPFAGFERSGGALAWVGGSRVTPIGTLGLQVNRATDADTGNGVVPTGDASVTSAAAAWRLRRELAPGLSAIGRLTAIRSSTNSPLAGSASGEGLFAEGTLISDTTRQDFGVFRAGAGLRFGDASLDDTRGAYWRMDRLFGPLGWGLGLQADRQEHEALLPGTHHLGLQANAQYQIDRRHSIGGAMAFDARHQDDGTDTRTRSEYATLYYQAEAPRRGRSRFALTLRRNQALVINGSSATGEEVAWEQDWTTALPTPGEPQFSTSIGLAHDRDGASSRVSPTAGVHFGYSPAPRWNLHGNLNYTSTRSNLSATQGLAGFVDSEYAFDNGWRIGASLNLNQVVVNTSEQTLLPNGSPQVFRTRDMAFAIWLRWDGSRGATARAIGRADARSVGGGALQGIVFFDENRDGRQQPQEQGVPGVEVILDGGFRTTTDRSGRFFFPLVATGPHRVTVRPESVPLPWGPADDRGWPTDVPLRGEATLAIPVVKVGE